MSLVYVVKYVVGVAIRWDGIIIEMFSQPGKLLRIAVSYCVQFVLPVTSLCRTRSRFDHRCQMWDPAVTSGSTPIDSPSLH